MPSLLTGNDSKAANFVRLFKSLGPEVAPRAILATWDKLSIYEQALVGADWSFWARSKQILSKERWNTWGFFTGRGFGKTITVSKFINGEVEAGKARLICLLAQDEQSSIDIQVLGPSGLIATAPPWFKPKWEASGLQLVWPNGARAYVRTPEVPGKIRGLEYNLAWTSELQSWPKSTMEDAWNNGVLASTRIGDCRIVWDATPKPKHPIISDLLALNVSDPSKNVIVRGSTLENASSLGDAYLGRLHKQWFGTKRYLMEVLGEQPDDLDGALWKQECIDKYRRLATVYDRKVVSLDPSITARKGSDKTGIVECGLGHDGQVYVIASVTDRYEPMKAVEIGLDWYIKHDCDLLLAETNKGGQFIAGGLKLLAEARGFEVIVVQKDERPRRQAGKVFVKENFARGAKEVRAEPVATAYERGRVSHVIGADLTKLEDSMTTWEPAPNADSPGDIDALVHAVTELLDLNNATPDLSQSFKGIAEVAKELYAPSQSTRVNTFTDSFRASRTQI